MAKQSAVKEKKERGKNFDWRKQKALLLGLDDKQYSKRMRFIMELRNAEFEALEAEHSRLGYCNICGRANTLQETCMNAGCPNSLSVKPKLTTEQWFELGCMFSINRVVNVLKDTVEELTFACN